MYFLFRDQYRNAPFTTYYVTVGYMIKEIHRCLLLLLGSEPSAIVITQVIKVISVNLELSDEHIGNVE